MKKTIYYTLAWAMVLLFALPLNLSAQAEKNTIFKVAVGDMSYTPKQKKATVGSVLGTIGEAVALGQVTTQHAHKADAVRASVVAGFGKVRRFNAIDGYFKEGEVNEETSALYVEGTINNISTTTEIYTPGDKKLKSYNVYKALIEVTVNVKDAKDDHIVDSHIFRITEYDMTWLKSTDSAIGEALILLSNRVSKHYNQLFPLNASIIEAGDTKKDKQKEVYIDLGEEAGATEGMKFTVYSIKTVGGRIAKKELGQVKITEVMGDEVSLCKVQSGGKNIKTALEDGMTVVVVSSN